MDEKKSVLSNNQVVESLKQDFQFANGLTENVDAAIKPYNRDILLQLRLHPLSLQKPRELPEIEVIKDKLYLNDITDMTSPSSEKHIDTSNYHPPVKPDYCNMKPDFSVLSPYFNKVYPYCYSSHAYNGSYQTVPLKCRSSFNTYCNPLKKHCMTSHQCLKDISLEECPLMKHFPSSDDMWNCYSNHMHSGTYKRKEHLEAVSKCRKKLPIIDPATGKNVLETVNSSQADQTFVDDYSKSVDNHTTSAEFCGDYFCSTKENKENADVYESDATQYNSISFSSGDKTCFEKPNSNAEIQADINTKSTKDNLEETCDNVSSTVDNIKDARSEDQKERSSEASEVKNNVFDFSKASEKVLKYDTSKYNKQVPKIGHNREMNTYFDAHSTCRAHSIKECHMHVCNENISKQHDTMQESLQQLKEKICSLKQEEQKVAILQSFLRYKKYQLEESARNLDEKRIEIANWEYNLYNKAKKLQEKEQWLENKNHILNNKTQQLIEKEKMLSEEDKILGDTLCSNTFKDTEVPEKKFAFDDNDPIWNEISKMKNPRIGENNEYSFVRYDSKQAKISEGISSNMEKCKSDGFSLDQLEKNLVFIQKMHSSNEVNDNPIDKIELASSQNIIQKSDENTSYDPLGYSKGRRYPPEHIKYWLDKRDKNTL